MPRASNPALSRHPGPGAPRASPPRAASPPATDPLGWVPGELDAIRASGLERTLRHLASGPGPEITLDGRRLVHLCSNNYLGLATDRRVVEAAAGAARRYGAGAGASRLVSGGTDLHRTLEARLAVLKGTEDCVVFSSGYLANLGTIPALVEAGDEVFSDAANHASIVDACRLSRARVSVWPHAGTEHLERILAGSQARRRLVVTDTVFSMDGDLAPLERIVEACERHGAMLMVDEAHATGLLGAGGAGAVEAAGLTGRVPVIMGTLSKALGAAGGFVCGSRELATLLRNRARAFIFDTALPPAAAGAALAALEVLEAEPLRRTRARDGARRLAGILREIGIPAPEPAAAVVPLLLGDAERAVEVAQRLLDAGVLAPAIRPPAVPAGGSRIRLTAMATHTPEHLDRAAAALRAALA